MAHQPSEQPPSSPSNDSGPGLSLRGVVGLGSFLVGAVVLATALGWALDLALDTSPALTLAGLAVGVVGGVAGCWLQVRRFLA